MGNEFNYEQFRIKLREYRKSLGMSIEAFAEAADMTPNNLTRIELGNHNPTVSSIIKCLNVLHKNLDNYFDDSTDVKDFLINKVNELLAELPERDQKIILDLLIIGGDVHG